MTHSGLSTCWELKQGNTWLQGHLAHDVHLPALCCQDRTWRHTYRYSIRQTACMVATNKTWRTKWWPDSLICKLSRGEYAIYMMLRCKVECMSHIGAMQGSMHAAGRLGDTQLVYTLLKMHSSHNRTIAYIPYTCFAATLKNSFWTFRLMCLFLCRAC